MIHLHKNDLPANLDLGPIVAIDTETNSLDPMQAMLCGFSLAITPNEACYVPLAHRKNGGEEGLFDAGLEPHQILEKDALDTIKPLLEDPGVLKIGQNIKYDLVVMRRYGVRLAAYDDTMLMAYAVDQGRGGLAGFRHLRLSHGEGAARPEQAELRGLFRRPR